MAASYPASVKTFSTKDPGNTINAAHINDLQDEVVAVETQLGAGAGRWASWTPTQTGWTALPTGAYRYSQIGKLVMCSVIMVAGDSNATTAVLSLPVNAATAGASPRGTWGWAMDNGTQLTTPGGWQIKVADQTISFYKTSVDGAAWTASGTKRIYCMFFYEAA